MHIFEYIQEFNLNESLLLQYSLDESKRQILLIVDSVENPPESLLNITKREKYDRCFLSFLFEEITSYLRTDNINSGLKGYDNCFIAKNHRSTVVIQKNLFKLKTGICQVELSFGSFGKGQFVCKNIVFDYKLGKAIKTGNAWRYFDILTDKEFDFYNPFDLDFEI
jgi:hypothetical protein